MKIDLGTLSWDTASAHDPSCPGVWMDSPRPNLQCIAQQPNAWHGPFFRLQHHVSHPHATLFCFTDAEEYHCTM